MAQDTEQALICRHWIGSDTRGHICGGTAETLDLCAKHYIVAKARVEKEIAKRRDQVARANAAWLARNARNVPAWRVQLERAESEYARRTGSRVEDRAAVGGAMHPSVVRAQRSALSDANVARVVELQAIIAKLRAGIVRAGGSEQ